MTTNRQILHIARTGAKLSNEQGRRVYFALPLGIRTVLEFDLRGEPNYFDGTLSPFPVQDYGATDFYFAIDESAENTNTPALLKTQGITISTDEKRHNIFRVSIPNTGTPELIAYLGKQEKAEVFAEIGGINAAGETVFAFRFNMYIVNRVYGGGCEDTDTEIDVSFVTATADDILKGKLSVDTNGEMIEGKIPTVEATFSENTVTVPAGYIPEEQTLTIPAATPTMRDNVVTVPQGYVTESQVFTVPEMTATLSENTVTVPKGYNPAKQVFTVPAAAEPKVTDNTVTINKGYQAEQKTVTIAEMAEPSVSANAVTIGKGYNPAQKTVTIPEAPAPDVSANVVTVNPGYVASKQTITIPEAGDLSVSGNTVSVPVGYIKSKRTATIPEAAEPSVTANKVTINAGYVPEQRTITIPEAAEPSVSGNVVTIKQGYNAAEKTVSVPEAGALTVSDNVVTVPVGYIKTQRTATVQEAGEPTVSGNVVTVKKGYVKSEKTVTVPESSGAEVNKNTVTVGKGYLEEDLTVEIPMGQLGVYDNGSGWNLGEGYYNETTLEVPSGSITISGNTVTISAGYLERKELTIPAGSVTIDTTVNKVIVSEGYVQSEELDLPGGFQLVKVTNYHPAREGFTAPSQIVISGIGTIGSDDYGTDGSAANGTYVITEDTKYKKGYARVYKQVDGKYYLAGYDSSAAEWAEYSSQWFIGTSTTSYGWSALLYYEGADIPAGEATWKNMDYGSATVTTTITNETISSLTETSLAQSVTAFDPDTAEWTEGDSVDISSYSITPQTNGIYFVQGGKLIGQPIDRELHIPKDGLVRRFKAVDGHFVDTVWGTEMLPHGDISYDELGYCGNSAAPMAGKTGSYLSGASTYSFEKKDYTFNIFVKPFFTNSTMMAFAIASGSDTKFSLCFGETPMATVSSWGDSYFIKGTTKPKFGRWNMGTATLRATVNPDNNERMDLTVSFYLNGVFQSSKTYVNNGWDFFHGNTFIFFDSADVTSHLHGQIDEACIWDRILTDEEIADMAKGLEDFNWDIPVKPYEQKQPVLYAPLTDTSKNCPTGQSIHINNVQNTEPLSERGFFRDGAYWNYRTNDSGSLEYEYVCIGQNYSSLYTSGSFTVCIDVYVEGYRDGINWQNYDFETSIISSNAPTSADGITLCSKKGSNSLFMRFKAIDGGTVPYNTWTTLIARSDAGKVDLFAGAVKGGYGTVTDHHPFSGYEYVSGPYNGLKCAIRNIRCYNRAVTDEEVAELSGIEKEEA